MMGLVVGGLLLTYYRIQKHANLFKVKELCLINSTDIRFDSNYLYTARIICYNTPTCDTVNYN